MNLIWKLCFGLVLLAYMVHGLGCMSKICEGNQNNNVLECRGTDQSCGYFKGRRRDHKHVEGIDLICPVDDYVFAPFDGEISYHLPFGGQKEQKCADQGVRLEGTGQWRGYYALISSIKLIKYGGKIKKGEKIGRAGNIECALENSQQSNQNYLRVEIFREGKPIDPTHYLADCMCTGQICETNWKNSLEGNPFKSDTRYNGVKGWEINCPLAEEEDDYEDRIHLRSPLIYSPIEGLVIGRKRVNFENGMYSGCENDGIFITGTGDWADFEVNIYNARYRPEIGFGKKHIVQHQPIGYRLNCSNSPNTVFVEVRFQGTVVNITDAILANNCKLPTFNNLF